MSTDYYELLGVSRTATAEEIKKAYRRLAREHHPDVNPDDAESEARFKEIAKAYEVLCDPDLRARYDQFGRHRRHQLRRPVRPGRRRRSRRPVRRVLRRQQPVRRRRREGGPGGSAAWPRPRGAGHARVHRRRVRLPDRCHGAHRCRAATCAPARARPRGTTPVTCTDCGGTGEQRMVRQTMLGQIVSATVAGAARARARSSPTRAPSAAARAASCTDKTYTVDVPAGVDTGSTLRLTGRGAIGPRRRPVGRPVREDQGEAPRPVRPPGLDLIHELPITMTQAALGHHLIYETLDGEEDLVIPRGTQSGRVFRSAPSWRPPPRRAGAAAICW